MFTTLDEKPIPAAPFLVLGTTVNRAGGVIVIGEDELMTADKIHTAIEAPTHLVIPSLQR